MANENSAKRNLTLVRGVASELGGGWTADPGMEEWMLSLVRDDGARLHVRVGGYKNEGRISFSGSFPKFADGQQYYSRETFKITVSTSRSTATIAREIKSRLLDAGYEVEMAKALADIAQSNAGAVAGLACAKVVASAAGGFAEPTSRVGESVKVSTDIDGVRAIRVSPAYTDHAPEVSFELHGLSPEVAAAVLALVRSGAVPVVEAPASVVVAPAPVAVAVVDTTLV